MNKVKTILHPDYWVEIPAGEFLTGISDSLQNLIRTRLHTQIDYDHLPAAERQIMERIIAKYRQAARQRLSDETGNEPKYAEFNFEERVVLNKPPFSTVISLEESLIYLAQIAIWLDRLYIPRFPVTVNQYGLFRRTPAPNLPGILEVPSDLREVSAIDPKVARRFCRGIGGRLPTSQEWEKAAMGTDGRLYPWGNDWDPEAGRFFYGQPGRARVVDAYPRGVSPYGVWFMVGGLPELTKDVERIGTHARESSAEMAWLDHIILLGKGGRWISFRPALDEWPEQQLIGFQAGLTIPNAAALQKMGPLADLLLTQYRWNDLDAKILDILEPAIVAVREARKVEAQELLTEILHNDDTLEAAWLLQATALEDISQQRECVQRAMTLNPEGEVSWKLAKLLQDPARVTW